LIAIESTLNGADGGDGSGNGDALTVTATADTYTVTVASANTPNTFSISRAANGTVTYPCANANNDGCPAGGWGG
jgi:hypothetical protein